MAPNRFPKNRRREKNIQKHIFFYTKLEIQKNAMQEMNTKIKIIITYCYHLPHTPYGSMQESSGFSQTRCTHTHINNKNLTFTNVGLIHLFKNFKK